MRNSALQLIFALLVLLLGAGAEELLPRLLGVGVPILLVSVHFFASRSLPAAVLFTLAAGAVEDAMSSMPMMTTASFGLMVVGLSRVAGAPGWLAYLTYPLYQLWLAVWSIAIGVDIFTRVLVSVPMGALAAWTVTAALSWIERKGALDEAS